MHKQRLNIFSISPSRSFVDVLAAGIMAETSGDPLALSDYLILLPTRRACRALRDAFLRLSDGKAMLLPQMQPMGDVDEDELVLGEGFDGAGDIDPLGFLPAISPLHRQLLLTSLVMQMPQGDDKPTPGQAARLAGELAQLLDQVQTEQVSLDNLEGLVASEYAEHWQKTLDFLEIIRRHWPDMLEIEGAVDPGTRRNQLLVAQGKAWATKPPKFNVIAAGSTGSVPATATLLHVIAKMPKGRVILPGLDRHLDADDWGAVQEDETHPQYGLARLLNMMETRRDAVKEWGAADPVLLGPTPINIGREVLISETLRPATTTDAWRKLPEFDIAALSGVKRLDCPTSAVEAGVISLMMREALETPAKTVALITPDRVLARRVALDLRRWEVDVDDSAGRPLGTTPPGSFLRLIADTVMQDLSPVSLLATLKHPLASLNQSPGQFRRHIRRLEYQILRGPKPDKGIAGLQVALGLITEKSREESLALVGQLEEALGPMMALMASGEVALKDLLDAHIRAAETLAASDKLTGIERLWTGDAGEALAVFVADLRDAGDHLTNLNPREYPALLETLMTAHAVRPQFGKHPRLFIWGPLEARLQQADLIILGGLNEGTWPLEPNPDPWMSRPMRKTFGLPLPERRVGLSAHDFCQALAAKNVVMTRANKVAGQPTVPSRWLSRLDVVLAKIGLLHRLDPDQPLQTWWEELGFAKGTPISMPEPRPPLAARPRQLSVTRIETWMRDPYSIFAGNILKLKPLEPLEADPGAADRGTFIHEALEKFIEKFPTGNLPPNAESILIEIGQTSFSPAISKPAVRAFWWPRFQRIVKWFLMEETKRRSQGRYLSKTESMGRHKISAPYADFTLTAKADRIDQMEDGGFSIIDYKTGKPPTVKDIEAGYAPQLSLEAGMLMQGAFEGLPAGDVQELAYWQLSGGDPAGKIQVYKKDIAAIAVTALEGLSALVVAFDNVDTPYRATPKAEHASRFNDYEHLSRIAEWARVDEGGE